MRTRTIGKVQISDITISDTSIKQSLNPFFIKEESLLTLEKKDICYSSYKRFIKIAIINL